MATSHDAEGDHLRARTSAAERLWFNNWMQLTRPAPRQLVGAVLAADPGVMRTIEDRYVIDELDTVLELPDVPRSSIGAPIPVVLSDEQALLLAYYLENRAPDWDGTSVRVVGPTTKGEPLAIVSFKHYRAFTFGPPNDEAFEGHPLAKRGLRPYRAFEIRHSSWIRRLERMNSVHPNHEPESFATLRHYVFAFHDSTFECVAEGWSVATLRGSMDDALAEMRRKLEWDAA